MRSMFLCLLGAVVAVAGVHAVDINVVDYPDFPSMFLGNVNHTESFLDLMTGHFNASMEFVFGSKFYSSQYSERPGMSKLLMEESNRHWEEGMDVLKKYLHLGGTTYGNSFIGSMSFTAENNFFGMSASPVVQYKGSLKSVMEKSRRFREYLTDVYHAANHRSSSHGDANVAHYLQEKTEKESDVARKMVGHYMTLQKMDSFGIALDMFDKTL